MFLSLLSTSSQKPLQSGYWESESGSLKFVCSQECGCLPMINALLLFFPLRCLGCDLELCRCARARLWPAPRPEFPHCWGLPLARHAPTPVLQTHLCAGYCGLLGQSSAWAFSISLVSTGSMYVLHDGIQASVHKART